MQDLVRCPACGVSFDPASADEAAFHGLGRCVVSGEEWSDTGTVGDDSDDEPPQG